MRIPRIILHVFDSESKTATLGYMVFLTATTGLFHGHVIDADTWLLCVSISSALIGGKLVGETMLNMRGAKKPDVKPDDPTPPAV